MLNKSKRLTTKQLNVVMAKGTLSHSLYFLLRSIQGQKDTRISAVAPVKVAKTAVARNFARRAIYNELIPLFGSIQPGIHGIIFTKKDIRELDKKEISSDLRELLRKSRLLKASN